MWINLDQPRLIQTNPDQPEPPINPDLTSGFTDLTSDLTLAHLWADSQACLVNFRYFRAKQKQYKTVPGVNLFFFVSKMHSTKVWFSEHITLYVFWLSRLVLKTHNVGTGPLEI